MSAVATRLDAAKAEGRAALIGYLPAGYPTVTGSCRAIEAMVGAGADIVEVGVAYSDPVLDGPVIQQATEAALRAGARVRDTFAAVRASVDAGAPALVMSYYNLLLQYGLERFADDLAGAGGSGVILPDLTPDIADDWLAIAAARDLESTFLVAPSSTQERIHMTVERTTGFVYAASLMGVTGVRATVGEQAERLVRDTRAAGARHVCVGLGVSTAQQAADVARYADGVIVGSALVRTLMDQPDEAAALAALRATTAELAAGVRGVA